MAKAKFRLGRLLSTPGALERVSHGEMLRALGRHVSGDWGNVCPEDAEANELAVHARARLLSSYTTEVPYRELLNERMPARAQRDPTARLAWLFESIEREEASLRAALKLVLRERHGRLSEEERGATVRAMAWSHLLGSRCQLRALRELTKDVHAELQQRRPQLALF